MDNALNQILALLQELRGIDFFGYRTPMVQRRIATRCAATGCKTTAQYHTFLCNHPLELDLLVDALTINVSRFFRDPLTFSFIARRLLPAIIHHKKEKGDLSLRIWSNGCAMGEEPYSMAILVEECLKAKSFCFETQIFATDIDTAILKKAQRGCFPVESIENISYRLLRTYFSMACMENEIFELIPKIRERVSFSRYDVLDKNSHAPPDSVFGEFDLILCRNLLLYFNGKYRNMIFSKLHRSLTQKGYLILGDTEVITPEFTDRFLRINDCCSIYQKQQETP